jgi:hypothetical protein
MICPTLETNENNVIHLPSTSNTSFSTGLDHKQPSEERCARPCIAYVEDELKEITPKFNAGYSRSPVPNEFMALDMLDVDNL